MSADRGGGTGAEGTGDPFAMPPGMVIRYERPAADIAGCITGYHVYGSDRPGQVDWFLPGTANVRITLNDAGPVAIEIADRCFDPIPVVSLFGPTSHAIRAVTNGGTMVGFGISAIGWARLTTRSAADLHDQVAAAGDVLAPALTEALQTALAAADIAGGGSVAAALDPLLRRALGEAQADEPVIRALATLIAADGCTDVVEAAARLGVPIQTLRRVATHYFGLTPKLLLTRARFLRSFLRIFLADEAAGYAGIDPSYFDVPHFLRDAKQYLGMTPRRFIAERTPFLRASVRARAAVLGVATQALHDPGGGAL